MEQKQMEEPEEQYALPEELLIEEQIQDVQSIEERLAVERKLWEKEHETALALEAIWGEEEMQDAVATMFAKKLNLQKEDVLYAMKETGSYGEMEAFARSAAREREAREMLREYPDFDLEQAYAHPAIRALVEAGEPLRNAYRYVCMEDTIHTAKEEAKAELLRSMQGRMNRPRVLQAPAHGELQADFRNLPESALRLIDERLKRGERVRV